MPMDCPEETGPDSVHDVPRLSGEARTVRAAALSIAMLPQDAGPHGRGETRHALSASCSQSHHLQMMRCIAATGRKGV